MCIYGCIRRTLISCYEENKTVKFTLQLTYRIIHEISASLRRGMSTLAREATLSNILYIPCLEKEKICSIPLEADSFFFNEGPAVFNGSEGKSIRRSQKLSSILILVESLPSLSNPR